MTEQRINEQNAEFVASVWTNLARANARLEAVEAVVRKLHIAGDLTNAATNDLLTAVRAAPEEAVGYEVVVTALGLDDAAQEALFDRVAEAAHALDEQLFCSGRLAGAVSAEPSEAT